MVWYGMVWYGMVWYGMVWYGMVWYGTARHGMVWYAMAWYGMLWYAMAWHGMVWYGMVWYGMVWYGIVWHGVVCLHTSDAHSCKVPTTGINMASLVDFSNRASKGIPPALRIARLFFVLLLQLHNASAPALATFISSSAAFDNKPQSSKLTYIQIRKKYIII
jgi:hypothetical protein